MKRIVDMKRGKKKKRRYDQEQISICEGKKWGDAKMSEENSQLHKTKSHFDFTLGQFRFKQK